MADFNKNPIVVPFFYTTTEQNPTKSKAEGRPIYDEVEMVEVRLAGERNFNPHFPAHSMWVRENGEEITYAMRWPDEYAQFKRGDAQTASGTPLEELVFLTAAERSELKALKIYTAESLAALDGPNLKVLAGKGYAFKEKAQAYISTARSHSHDGAAAAENAELRAQLETMQAQIRQLQSGETPIIYTEPDYDGMSEDQLKDKIAERFGTRPRGNPNRATLLNMLTQPVAA